MLLKPMQPFIMVSVKCWKGWEANEIFKNDCNRGAWKIFTRDGGKPGMGGGGGFIMRGWEVFEVLLHSWQGVLSPLYFMKTPYIAYPPFFKFWPTSPHFPVTSNPHPHSFGCPVSLAEWVIT